MKQSTWEAWLIVSMISVFSVLFYGSVSNSDATTYIIVISVVSINLAVCLYHGSKPSK
jgi:hypothetical protein